jgi:hypothetical protein
MKTLKLMIIAAVIVAAIIGISQLLNRNDNGSGTEVDSGNGVSRFNDISKTIEEMEKVAWNKELYAKTYTSIVNRIKANRQNNNLRESEAQTLSDKAELAYINILIKAVSTEIVSCKTETMKQLKQELEEFVKMGTHDGIANFKQTVQNMKDYETAQNFVYSVYALRNKQADPETKFPDASSYHNRAETLGKNDFVAQCSRLVTSLSNVDKELYEAHAIFLDKKTDLFIASGFSDLKTKTDVDNKFKSIEAEIDVFLNNYSFYPYNLKKKKADSLLLKIEDRKKDVLANLKE